MDKFQVYFLLFGLVLLFILGCENPNSESATTVAQAEAIPAQRTALRTPDTRSIDYWNQGKAELNRYDLQQNRYESLHPGEVVLIFVKEDFLTDRQVKNDYYRNPNSTPVLKTNQIRRFTTGLYDYSVMTSVFTPMDGSETSKVTFSAQDWCGQVFGQINYRDGAYHHQLYSYFESEGDVTESAKADLLEDELFNQIRLLGPEVPTGTFALIPSMTYLRLRHQPFAPYRADLSLSPYQGEDLQGEDLLVYTAEFPELDKQSRIVFEGVAPFRIVAFTETYPSAFDGIERTTQANLTDSIFEPYWEQNSAEDTILRRRLGLESMAAFR